MSSKLSRWKMPMTMMAAGLMSVWQTFVSLVLLPTYVVQWLVTGPPVPQQCPRKKMSDKQSENGCTNSPLTTRDFELIQQSWRLLAEDKKTNGVKLFMKFFTMYPEAQDMFKFFKGVPLEELDYNGETTKKNKRMIAHALSVMYALESYVDTLDDMECLVELVRKTALSHMHRHIGPNEFAWLGPVLLSVLDDLTKGKSVDLPAIKDAWTKLLGAVVSIVAEVQSGE